MFFLQGTLQVMQVDWTCLWFVHWTSYMGVVQQMACGVALRLSIMQSEAAKVCHV